MWNLKIGYNELCRTDTESQTLKKLLVTEGNMFVGRDGLGVRDGNAIQLGFNDPCTTINVIKCIELKKENNKCVL